MGGLALDQNKVATASKDMAGLWIGLGHVLLAMITLLAALHAHDFAFRCAMSTFAVYAVLMAANEALVLLKDPAI